MFAIKLKSRSWNYITSSTIWTNSHICGTFIHLHSLMSAAWVIETWTLALNVSHYDLCVRIFRLSEILFRQLCDMRFWPIMQNYASQNSKFGVLKNHWIIACHCLPLKTIPFALMTSLFFRLRNEGNSCHLFSAIVTIVHKGQTKQQLKNPPFSSSVCMRIHSDLDTRTKAVNYHVYLTLFSSTRPSSAPFDSFPPHNFHVVKLNYTLLVCLINMWLILFWIHYTCLPSASYRVSYLIHAFFLNFLILYWFYAVLTAFYCL